MMAEPTPNASAPASDPPVVPSLVPARMLNEFAYCPRLFFLEWVDGEWQDSADTEEGRFRHRRVDHEGGVLPEGGSPNSGPADGAAPTPVVERIHVRSLLLSAEKLGAIARLDLLEGDGTRLTPVDYKRGSVPDVEGGAWEPEKVQLCLQGLILRENGYTCDEGYLYYAESHQRVRVPFDPPLVERTLELLGQLRQAAEKGKRPPPLEDSPKCPRCSLVGICLPDETRLLGAGSVAGDEVERPARPDEPRRLVPARDDALPLYVQSQGMSIHKQGDRLEVRDRGQKVQDVRLLDVSQVCVFGNVQVTTQALRELLEREAPVCYFTYGGWFYGISQGMGHKNVELRRLQYRVAEDPVQSLALATRFVVGKIKNTRTMLRRNCTEVDEEVLRRLTALAQSTLQARDAATLLGLEGTAARLYFEHFGGMLKPRFPEQSVAFDFSGRNRRPPRDPVNALLSLAYSLLAKDFTVTLLSVGFDPFLGFYHTPRYGRTALALDLMEEFRPLLGDSVVVSVINNGEITAADFVHSGGAVNLTPSARRRFIEAYGRRMDTLVTHPIFGYTISYRRVIEVQSRLLARYLTGEIPEYPSFVTR